MKFPWLNPCQIEPVDSELPWAATLIVQSAVTVGQYPARSISVSTMDTSRLDAAGQLVAKR